MFTGKPEEYRGVYALLLTPFNEDKSINYDTYAKYVEWQAARGAHHLFSVCGSSEMTYLTLEERIKCAETAVKHANGVEVVATANLEPTWKEQVEEVKRIEQTGVDGLVFVTRGYGSCDKRIVENFSELSEYTSLPIILYEFPGFEHCSMSGKAYGELVKTGKFHGIKDTTCSMDGIRDKIAYQGDSAVLQANIPLLLDAYNAGARGVCACIFVKFKRIRFERILLISTSSVLRWVKRLERMSQSAFAVSSDVRQQIESWTARR